MEYLESEIEILYKRGEVLTKGEKCVMMLAGNRRVGMVDNFWCGVGVLFGVYILYVYVGIGWWVLKGLWKRLRA